MSDKDFAYPQTKRLASELWTNGGLTKREKIAMHCLQGMLSSLTIPVSDINPEAMADNAVLMADALIQALSDK